MSVFCIEHYFCKKTRIDIEAPFPSFYILSFHTVSVYIEICIRCLYVYQSRANELWFGITFITTCVCFVISFSVIFISRPHYQRIQFSLSLCVQCMCGCVSFCIAHLYACICFCTCIMP